MIWTVNDAMNRWLRGQRPAPNAARPDREVEAAIVSVIAQVPRTFLADGYHVAMALFVKGKAVAPLALDVPDAARMDDAYEGLRRAAARFLPDAVVVVTEGWQTDLKTLRRSEVLTATVERVGGAPAETFLWPIVRGGDRPPGLGARRRFDSTPSAARRVLPGPPLPPGKN